MKKKIQFLEAVDSDLFYHEYFELVKKLLAMHKKLIAWYQKKLGLSN